MAAQTAVATEPRPALLPFPPLSSSLSGLRVRLDPPLCAVRSLRLAIKAFRSASAVAALYRGEARGEGERREIGSDPANGRPGRGDLILLDMTVGGAWRRRMAVWKSSCNISLKGERSRVLGNVGSRPCRIYDWMILLIMGAFAKVVK